MDYTIILLDNFTKERKRQAGVEEALANSIRKSIIPIASAGTAAIVGFSALVLMRFSIGKDIGLVLAKGIAISVVTVMLLTSLCLAMVQAHRETEHKPPVPIFDRVSEKIYRYRYVILIVLLLLAIPSSVGKDMTDFSFKRNQAMGLTRGTQLYADDEERSLRYSAGTI